MKSGRKVTYISLTINKVCLIKVGEVNFGGVDSVFTWFVLYCFYCIDAWLSAFSSGFYLHMEHTTWNSFHPNQKTVQYVEVAEQLCKSTGLH